MKIARNDQIDEFWRCPNFHVPGGHEQLKSPLSRKLCAIAHENGQKWPNRWFWWRPNFRLPGGLEPLKSSPEPKKTVCYSPRKRPEMTKSMILATSQFSCTRGHEPLKSSPEPKTMCYDPWKRLEMTKSMSFDDVPIFVYRGHETSKSPPDPKTVYIYCVDVCRERCERESD